MNKNNTWRVELVPYLSHDFAWVFDENGKHPEKYQHMLKREKAEEIVALYNRGTESKSRHRQNK